MNLFSTWFANKLYNNNMNIYYIFVFRPCTSVPLEAIASMTAYVAWWRPWLPTTCGPRFPWRAAMARNPCRAHHCVEYSSVSGNNGSLHVILIEALLVNSNTVNIVLVLFSFDIISGLTLVTYLGSPGDTEANYAVHVSQWDLQPGGWWGRGEVEDVWQLVLKHTARN